MKLQDLSDRTRRVLLALHSLRVATRAQLAEACNLERNYIGGALNRLEGFGFVTKAEHGGDWRISEEGDQLFADPQPGPQPDPVATSPTVEQSPAPQLEPLRLSTLESMSAISEMLLENQELNAAMDDVVARLASLHVPASALRTYRRLIDALPPPVQKALSPITQLVEAQP